MAPSKRVLVIADPTAKQQPAAERGAWLAQRLDAELELFICDYDQYLAGERFWDSRSLEKARKSLIANDVKRLNEIARGLAVNGTKVRVDARWDHPLPDGIVRKVVSSDPTIVVKDTHYHTALRRSIFSNTDWHLIRECPAPLLLVKPRPIHDTVTVIAAVDPMHEHDKAAELDHEIMRMARTLSEATGAELHVLHAFDPSPVYAVSADSMTFPISVPMNEVTKGLKKRHEEAVETLTNGYDIPSTNVHVVEGDTRTVLTSSIENLKADVVVMGAVSRGFLQRLALGSTAERVLDHVPCDLMIVKPKGIAAEATMRNEHHGRERRNTGT